MPWAWAASSITCRLWRRARALTASMSAMVPKTWTGMMARVRGVTARSAAATSRQKVSGSRSAKTGTPLVARTALAVAIQVIPGTITSSP